MYSLFHIFGAAWVKFAKPVRMGCFEKTMVRGQGFLVNIYKQNYCGNDKAFHILKRTSSRKALLMRLRSTAFFETFFETMNAVLVLLPGTNLITRAELCAAFPRRCTLFNSLVLLIRWIFFNMWWCSMKRASLRN